MTLSSGQFVGCPTERQPEKYYLPRLEMGVLGRPAHLAWKWF